MTLLGHRNPGQPHWQTRMSHFRIGADRRRQIAEQIARACGWVNADAMRVTLGPLRPLHRLATTLRTGL